MIMEVNMAGYIELGKKIYDMNNPREVRRMAVFVARSILHNSGMQTIINYFDSNAELKKFIEDTPFPIEQVTRAFFYKGSTFDERCKLVREHFDFCYNTLKPEYAFQINSINRPFMDLWTWEFEGQIVRAALGFGTGQRKEGLSSVILYLGEKEFYQIIFWIAKDKKGNDSLWIGAMQGPNRDEAKDIIKRMTKACHGYRTKNMILYIIQAVARSLGLKKIYAVTNEGYYANNHARVDRKLKTSFSDFWSEAGGNPTDDSRFYELPLVEARKTMEEVPTRKRAVYRRRFAMLDEIDNSISDSVKNILK